MIETLIVIAKYPAPGRVKTRLVPPFTDAEAAELAAAALTDTLDAADATPVNRRLLAFDRHPGRWLRPGWTAARQPDGGLDRRLGAAFRTVTGPALLVGMDTPQVMPGQLASFDHSAFDACVGLASDGGYWAIGFRDPRLATVATTGVPMSVPQTAEHQLRRLAELGLRVQVLDELTDVDTAESARAVADIAPGTRFAATLSLFAPLATVSGR